MAIDARLPYGGSSAKAPCHHTRLRGVRRIDRRDSRRRTPVLRGVARVPASRALARGVSPGTYDRVTRGLEPDMRALDDIRSQPEFHEKLWQYLNRRVSEWRITIGKDKLKEQAATPRAHRARIRRGPAVILGLWGIESAYGDPVVQSQSFASRHSVARRARMGRAAPPRLLGDANSSTPW